MKFDPSKVIENPKSLADGVYFMRCSLSALKEDVIENESYFNITVTNGRPKWSDGTDDEVTFDSNGYYHPKLLIEQLTHRTKHRRVLAPLWERTKK